MQVRYIANIAFFFLMIIEAVSEFEEKQDSRMGLSHFPTMEQLLQMRENPRVYSWFCRHFMLCVVGTKNWMNNCRQFPMHVFVTVSDEAFALTQLENSYERWMDMYKNSTMKTSEIKAKFTNSGKSEKGDGRSKRFCGWTMEGLTFYNQQYDEIGRNRQEFPDFDQRQLEDLVKHYEGMKEKVVVAEQESPLVEPRHDMPWNPVTPPVAQPDGGQRIESEEDDDEGRWSVDEDEEEETQFD